MTDFAAVTGAEQFYVGRRTKVQMTTIRRSIVEILTDSHPTSGERYL